MLSPSDQEQDKDVRSCRSSPERQHFLEGHPVLSFSSPRSSLMDRILLISRLFQPPALLPTTDLVPGGGWADRDGGLGNLGQERGALALGGPSGEAFKPKASSESCITHRGGKR